MKDWRTEYKILLFIGVLFFIVLILFLIRTDALGKMTASYKESKLIECTSKSYTKGIKYEDYTCIVKDEYGNSYTISYPQIEEKSDDIKSLNTYLKKDFNDVSKSIEYSNANEKLQFASYQKVNYKIHNSSGVVSFLIEKEDRVGEVLNTVNQYQIYNIDLSTYEILDSDEIKEKFSINRDYSSNLKGIVTKMYLSKFRYDYNNELPVYRNQYIDSSIEDITYRSINNLYIDDDGNINFILYLFNPNYGEKIPYNFALDKNGNTTYEPIGYN